MTRRALLLWPLMVSADPPKTPFNHMANAFNAHQIACKKWADELNTHNNTNSFCVKCAQEVDQLANLWRKFEKAARNWRRAY